MKKIKQNKGSITLFVLIAILFFVSLLITSFVATSQAKQNQLEASKQLKALYADKLSHLEETYQLCVDAKRELHFGAIISPTTSADMTMDIMSKSSKLDLQAKNYTVQEGQEIISNENLNYKIAVQDSNQKPTAIFDITMEETKTGQTIQSQNGVIEELVLEGGEKQEKTYHTTLSLASGQKLYGKQDFSFVIEPVSQSGISLGEERLPFSVTNDKLQDFSANGYHATLNGNTVIKESDGTWAIAFDGIDDFIQIPTLSKNFHYEDGLTFEATVKYEALNNNSMILMLGNGYDTNKGDGYDSIILQTPTTTPKLAFYIKTQNAVEVKQFDVKTNGNVINLNQKMKISTRIYTQATFYKGEMKINDAPVATSINSVSSVIYGIPNVERRQNYLGKSSWPSDSYFKGKIYSAKLIDGSGETIFDYDVNR